VRRVWIRCLITVIFSFQFIVPVAALSTPKVGQFILVNGDITLIRAGVMYKPAVREDVQEGDVIQTGKNASVKVMLQDDTVITIDRNSRFIMKKFALRGGIRSAKIYLAFGKIAADVKRFVGGRNTFDLESPTAVAGLSGTVVEFAVVIGADGVPTTTVTCLSGSVVVTTAAGSVALATGQTAVAVASIAPAVTTATTAAAAAGTAGGTATTMTIGAGTIAIGAVIVAALVAAAVALSGGGGGGGGGGNTLSGHTTTTHH
jgi:hypothetical protein